MGLRVDLNADLGEGYPNDEQLMGYITSANIACGMHAGSETIMRETVRLAIKYSVAVGAHPGYNDRANFGRVDLNPGYSELVTLVTGQLEALSAICGEEGTGVLYVKPHGALYNRAAADLIAASAVVAAIKEFNPALALYGPFNSQLAIAAAEAGLTFRAEVFADRGYRDDASLVPRGEKGAIITDRQLAVERVLRMVREGKVETVTGNDIAVLADTICLHGDNEKAVEFAGFISRKLRENGVEIVSCHG